MRIEKKRSVEMVELLIATHQQVHGVIIFDNLHCSNLKLMDHNAKVT